MSKEDMYVIAKCGRNQPRKKTVGWKLLVHWNGEYESWIHLKDMKEYHLVEVESLPTQGALLKNLLLHRGFYKP